MNELLRSLHLPFSLFKVSIKKLRKRNTMQYSFNSLSQLSSFLRLIFSFHNETGFAPLTKLSNYVKTVFSFLPGGHCRAHVIDVGVIVDLQDGSPGFKSGPGTGKPSSRAISQEFYALFLVFFLNRT